MIEFQNIFVKYSGGITGLNGVNLSIKSGELVCLIGPTGSGKSTLLKLLIREKKATSGRVILGGQELNSLPESSVPALRRQIGFVPQDILLLPAKKVWENLSYAMRAVGHTRREVRRRVPEMLEKFGILHRADAFPSQLSGGEQQRVAIARALINNPSLLIADEPTGHLDPDTSAEIVGLLEHVNARGTTVLMASHDLPMVEMLHRRVVALESGQIVSDTFGLNGGGSA